MIFDKFAKNDTYFVITQKVFVVEQNGVYGYNRLFIPQIFRGQYFLTKIWEVVLSTKRHTMINLELNISNVHAFWPTLISMHVTFR